jgi:inorganic pyrophosphatase
MEDEAIDQNDLVVDVIVETPTGSRNKYEMDERRGVIRLDRRLPSATIYPADYGYVADTLARDGDPLDALVIVEDRTFPGCMIRSRIVGLFVMSDEEGPDSKLITVPEWEPRWADVEEIEDLPLPLLDEIKQFFAIYKDLEPNKSSQVKGFRDRLSALEELRDSAERYRASVAGMGADG